MTAWTGFDVGGRRILLVGATGILGRGYARALAECDARLVIADRPGSDVLAYADELGVTGLEADVTDEAQVAAAVVRAVELHGGLDGAINNAAATGESLIGTGDAFAPFEDYPIEAWRKVIDVNLTGTFLVAREAGRAMKATAGKPVGGASLVNIASIYGIVGPDHRVYEGQPFKSFASYSASKGGVIGLTRWLATWWARDGIRVNAVTPGGVYNGHDPSFTDAYGNRTPMGRMANREELIGMILYLLSDAASYCTGQNYVVDGGFSAW